ncbi:MAG: SagB/ThcOx family dehydrogenase [Symbiobacteriaceae bacterium]|nr:SagB/ThcOx family dehydrogenase [Symbiobacteriaceae bacterium]
MRHPSYLGRTFMELTKYKYQAEKSDQTKMLPQPELTDPAEPGCQLFDLPDPQKHSLPSVDLFQAINERVSVRAYSEEPLSLEELSYLLWCTQGIKQVTDRPATLRTVPSAGARHPFETYLLINKVEGLAPGLYKYSALDHKVALISTDPELPDKLTQACHRQGMVKNSAVTFFWVAVVYRTFWRYVERGYRYLHLDAGHVCQNLYLAVAPMNAGCCGIAAFDDEMLSQLLGVDGENRAPIYLATVGKKKE